MSATLLLNGKEYCLKVLSKQSGPIITIAKEDLSEVVPEVIGNDTEYCATPSVLLFEGKYIVLRGKSIVDQSLEVKGDVAVRLISKPVLKMAQLIDERDLVSNKNQPVRRKF